MAWRPSYEKQMRIYVHIYIFQFLVKRWRSFVHGQSVEIAHDSTQHAVLFTMRQFHAPGHRHYPNVFESCFRCSLVIINHWRPRRNLQHVEFFSDRMPTCFGRAYMSCTKESKMRLRQTVRNRLGSVLEASWARLGITLLPCCKRFKAF